MRAKAGAARRLRVAPTGAWLGTAFYRQHLKQATIWATITDTTPDTVAALLTDPAPTTTHL